MSKKNLNKNVTVARSSSSKITTGVCSNFSELGPSRGRVFRNGSGGAAPKFQFRTRSVTVAKTPPAQVFYVSRNYYRLSS